MPPFGRIWVVRLLLGIFINPKMTPQLPPHTKVWKKPFVITRGAVLVNAFVDMFFPFHTNSYKSLPEIELLTRHRTLKKNPYQKSNSLPEIVL